MNDKFGLKPADLSVIIQTIAAFTDVKKAVIFGSRAKGNYKAGSDVDIALWTTDNNTVLKAAGTLNDETLLPYKFDLLNYETLINNELRDHIDRIGVSIYHNISTE